MGLDWIRLDWIGTNRSTWCLNSIGFSQLFPPVNSFKRENVGRSLVPQNILVSTSTSVEITTSNIRQTMQCNTTEHKPTILAERIETDTRQHNTIV
mmetsp:Transcript_2510/g.5630  ORF Transcript_2510/g.5630 Transcript_2510/m.5630 type:complete len:96 (+) Transcript_2510:1410-1697(+)